MAVKASYSIFSVRGGQGVINAAYNWCLLTKLLNRDQAMVLSHLEHDGRGQLGLR